MKHWISLPRSEGRASRQAHADLPEGSYEREIGRDGFFGPATHMYHAHPPTGWSRFEGPLRPRALDTTRLQARTHSPWDAAPLLVSPHVRYRFWRAQGSMPDLVRNADGDELLFLHDGAAELFCDYGHLSLRDGDYLVLPRGTLWRLQSAGPFDALLIEASGASYRLPDRGLLGAHAFFDPAALETPRIDEAFLAQQGEQAWRVVVQARGQLSTITYPFNPLDAIGWKGDLAPVRINWRDLRPVVSARYHLPPSVHTTFASEHFVVCTFCPRPLESDPGALKLPFFHSNDDYDEVIFYHRGSFMSRDDIRAGSISFHPRGFTHGPHPKALQASRESPRRETDEVAVMIDTRAPLDLTPEALAIEDPGYVCSWGASG